MSDIYTKIEDLKYIDNNLYIEGFVNLIGIDESEKVEVYLSVDKSLKKCILTSRKCSEYKFGRLYYRGVPFKINIKIDNKSNHVFKIVTKIRGGHCVVQKNLRFNEFCPINSTTDKYYFVSNSIFKTDGSYIYMTPSSLKNRLKNEIKYQKNLSFKNKILRWGYFLFRLFSRKEIWLISDRHNKAGDNGEAYFKHLQKNKLKNVKTYFVIDKETDDYKRLKEAGKVIDINSKKFRFYLLVADKLISSHLDFKFSLNYDKRVFSDIIAHRTTVFLQHGITKDDISSVYSKYRYNIDLFITAAKNEYLSIVNNCNYGLTENNVKLTGFARFDNLVNNPQKIITIMPTWRKNYCKNINGDWKLSVDLRKTKYFNEYNKIFESEELNEKLRKKGYIIEFIQHPLMGDAFKYFKETENIKIKEATNYAEIFEKTALLVTDYSSTAFDIAYLRKPILYFQFDKDEFFETHSYKKGYFDYEKDGFGEVSYDSVTLINTLIKYIQNNCKESKYYQKRVDTFFAYNDNKSAERITKEILKIKK